MDKLADSISCCLCDYQVSTELELETHIDQKHSDIFKPIAASNDVQKNHASKYQSLETIREPTENNLQEKLTQNPNRSHHSAKHRSQSKKGTPMGSLSTLKRGSSPDANMNETNELPKGGWKKDANLTENDIKKTVRTNLNQKNKFPNGKATAKIVEASRGQKRLSTKSEAEPCSKRAPEESTTEESPILQATTFIEALGKSLQN